MTVAVLQTMGKAKAVSTAEAEAAGNSGKTVLFTNLKGLMEDWDSVPKLRLRCKELGALLVECPPAGCKEQAPATAIAKTTDNARYNAEVLMPLLKRMQDARFAVPCIESLSAEIIRILESYGYKPQNASDQAWSIRYILGKVKGASYKDAPPRVP